MAPEHTHTPFWVPRLHHRHPCPAAFVVWGLLSAAVAAVAAVVGLLPGLALAVSVEAAAAAVALAVVSQVVAGAARAAAAAASASASGAAAGVESAASAATEDGFLAAVVVGARGPLLLRDADVRSVLLFCGQANVLFCCVVMIEGQEN